MNLASLQKSILLLSACGLTLPAQSDFRHFTAHIGGGPTFVSNRSSDYVKNGYNMLVGGGYRANRMVEFLGEFNLNQSDVQQSVLNQLSVPGGDTTFYSLTGNVKLNLIPVGPANVYVIGGGGWYRRTVRFTEPTTSVVTVFDPWWGYGQVVVPTNAVLGSVTRDSGGFNGGGGLEFRLGPEVRVFAEARWHRAYHNPTNSTLIPLTIGIRF